MTAFKRSNKKKQVSLQVKVIINLPFLVYSSRKCAQVSPPLPIVELYFFLFRCIGYLKTTRVLFRERAGDAAAPYSF